MGRFISNSPAQTKQLGSRLANTFTGGEIVAFTGGLGAGKTVFCTGIAQALGSTDPVQSPTFAIVNFYRGRVPFAHFDAYRIVKPEDLETAGFYDYIEQGAVVAVEWFENIAEYISEEIIQVHIRPLGTNLREIVIEGKDDF